MASETLDVVIARVDDRTRRIDRAVTEIQNSLGDLRVEVAHVEERVDAHEGRLNRQDRRAVGAGAGSGGLVSMIVHAVGRLFGSGPS